MKVSIDKTLQQFAESEVRSGRYGSIDEVVQTGLRLLADREQHLQTLRTSLRDALGDPRRHDWDEVLAEIEADFEAGDSARGAAE